METGLFTKNIEHHQGGLIDQNQNLVQRFAITVFLSTLTISGVIAWIYTSYFKGSYATLLVFFGQDGNCETASQGLGIHCFGDYSAIHFNSLWDKPIGAELVYPVITRVFRLPFLFIENLTNYRVGLYFYLAALFVAAIFPVVHHCINNKNQQYRTSLIFLATINIGLISTLDRGNVIGFAVPCLYMFLLNFRKNLFSKAGWWLVLASAVKPQIAIFAIAFLWASEFRVFFYSIIRVITLLTVPFSVFGLKGFGYFQDWLVETQKWSSSLLPSSNFPSNYSFNKIIGIFGSNFSEFSFLLGIFLIVVISVRHWRTGKGAKVSSIDLVQLGLIMTCMNSIVYVYYTVLLIPLLTLLLQPNVRDEALGDGERRVATLLASLIAFAMAPLAIPSRWILSDQAGEAGAFNQIPTLVVFLLTLSILYCAGITRRSHYWKKQANI